MAQDVFINVTASNVKGPDGRYAHSSSYGSAASGDISFSWDHTKFTTRQQLLDAFILAQANVSLISNLK